MITTITILSNGNIAPNQTIVLGKQHESVGDILRFEIPNIYKGYHYYLAFYMKKQDPILLPVNYTNGALDFIITSTVTRNSGTYEMVFIATEDAVIKGNINDARKVFVSTTMLGYVEDNPVDDPVVDEELDENLQIIYDELLDLKNEITYDLDNDVYRGASYIPYVNNDGIISWTRSDGKDISIPEPVNLTGPQGRQGAYYIPEENEGIISWSKSQEGIPNADPVDLNPLVENASNNYLNENLKPAVNEAVDAKLRLVWDDENKILKIYTENYNPEEE